jgi:hypothetical protein
LVRLAEGPAQGRATELAGPEALTMASMTRRLAQLDHQLADPGMLTMAAPTR